MLESNKLFVGGLSPETDELALRQYFGKFGRLTDARVRLEFFFLKSIGLRLINWFNYLRNTAFKHAAVAFIIVKLYKVE